MSGLVSLYSTFPDEAEARRVGRRIVDERLAACVNILGPCASIYRWHGKVEETAEVAAIFKTSAAISEALIRRLLELHSYEAPAIAIWPIVSTTDTYRDWVLSEIAPASRYNTS